jgi:hypothetical protein
MVFAFQQLCSEVAQSALQVYQPGQELSPYLARSPADQEISLIARMTLCMRPRFYSRWPSEIE